MFRILIIFLFINFTQSYAIVFRHDKDVSAYMNLAKQTEFDFVGELIKIDKGDIHFKNSIISSKILDTMSNNGTCELINKNWVITAAHLLTEEIKKDTSFIFEGHTYNSYVVLGEYIDNNNRYYVRLKNKIYEIDTIIINSKYLNTPDYPTRRSYDVALLRLKEPIQEIKPVKLYNQENEVGKVGYCVGWGYYNDAYSNNEKKGKLAGQNTIDSLLIFNNGMPDILECDFDCPQVTGICENNIGNTEPLELECMTTGGDSGSGFIVSENSELYLLGVSPSGGVVLEQFKKSGYYCHNFNFIRVSSLINWINESIK